VRGPRPPAMRYRRAGHAHAHAGAGVAAAFLRAGAALLGLALIAACGFVRIASAAPAGAAFESVASAGSGQTLLYLARRSWHIDVGFAVDDLDPSLAFIAERFPRARYLFFGFGDRHYLLTKAKGTSTLAGALFPGPGLILVTAIENSPSQAFGTRHVLEFRLSARQAAAAQDFVRRALAEEESPDAAAVGRAGTPPVAEGPYEGSAYYAAVARYSAFHTCNTWAAEALQSAGFKVRTRGVLFAGQTWRQARKISAGATAPAAAPQGVPAP
jgi:hypothetical protein